eukprot:4773197-Amphidinium_carterae.1
MLERPGRYRVPWRRVGADHMPLPVEFEVPAADDQITRPLNISKVLLWADGNSGNTSLLRRRGGLNCRRPKTCLFLEETGPGNPSLLRRRGAPKLKSIIDIKGCRCPSQCQHLPELPTAQTRLFLEETGQR